MEKIIIYGAGNWCRLLLKNSQLKQYEIIKVVDGDKKKWNTKIENFLIESPEILTGISYDKILIAAKAYQGIAETLTGEFQISQNKILYVDFDNNWIHELKDSGIQFGQGFSAVVEKRLFRKLACEVIQESLLFECMQDGEFYQHDNCFYDEIIVVGSEAQFYAVKAFFSCMNENAPVPKREQQDASIIHNGKYVLTAASYKEDLKRLRSRGAKAEQCVIAALFDVEATVII